MTSVVSNSGSIKQKGNFFKIPTPGAVRDNRSDFATPLWNLIVDKLGEEGEIKQGYLAEKIGCSVRTIRDVLKGFSRCDLIEMRSYNGQGHGVKITNHWVRKSEKIKKKLFWKRAHDRERKYLKSYGKDLSGFGRNPLDCLGIPSGVLTKGSRPAKYLMYKLRTFLEETDLSHRTGMICGKIFNYLQGKDSSKGIKWLSRLKDVMEVGWDLVDFFCWFHELKGAERKEKLEEERTEEMLEKRKKKREKVKKERRGNPPPKISDFDRFSDYKKALDEYSGEKKTKGANAREKTPRKEDKSPFEKHLETLKQKEKCFK